MTAVADFTTICTILKGSAPTNPQLSKWQQVFAPDATGTNEQKAAAAIAAIKQLGIDRAKRQARDAVIASKIRVAHFPADQPAIIAAAEPEEVAAENTAVGGL